MSSIINSKYIGGAKYYHIICVDDSSMGKARRSAAQSIFAIYSETVQKKGKRIITKEQKRLVDL
jgi:hypothetical protein